MGIKSFFSKIFKTTAPSTVSPSETNAKFLNSSPSEPTKWTGEIYANHLVRGIVHKIASFCSMISFEHVSGEGDQFKVVKDSVHRLLTIKPNKYMTPSELIYKHISALCIKNNAYIWVKRDSSGTIVELLPIVCDYVKMIESNGFLFYKFTFLNGEKLVVYYEDIIHQRDYFYENDWFGSDNEPLRDSIGLVDTMEISVDASLKNGAQIKGILQHQNTIDPDDLAKHEKLFRESYLKASNSGGVGMIDAKFNFIPVAYSGKIIDAEQMREIRDYVYRYFGMNDKIMLSSYNSDEWQAYYEGKIAPILNGLEQKFKVHLFSDKEIGYGNRIISSVNNISFMSATQKINMVKYSLEGGLYNRNEVRQWFGDAPIPGGDVYQISKNYTEETSTNQDKGDKDATGKTDKTDTTSAIPKEQ